MKKIITASVLLATMMSLGLSRAVLADPPGDKPPGGFTACDLGAGDVLTQRCLVELKEVQDTINDAESLSDRDRDSLTSKVCLANDKLMLEKWDDAAQKLTDVSDTVNSKHKVDPIDAAAISAAALSAASDIVNFTCDLDQL